MSSPFTARQAGIAGIVAATLILVSQLSQLLLPMAISESFWYATQAIRLGLALAAMFALLIALTGLYASQARAAGTLGLIGYLTASLGTLLVAGNWWYEAFIGPEIRAQAPELLATAPGGSIILGALITGATFAAGWLILGIATIRAGVLPRNRAILLTIGGLAGVLSLIAPFQVPLALAVGWIGWWLVGSAARESAPAAAAAASAATAA